MSAQLSAEAFTSLYFLGIAETFFVGLYALLILKTTGRAVAQRLLGLAILGMTTYVMEKSIVRRCLDSGRPHWAATTACLLWVQLLNVSELIIVSRVDSSQLLRGDTNQRSSLEALPSALGLLFNLRRIGTQWQVKNVPSASKAQPQTRIAFILQRAIVTFSAYLFVDFVVSMPPPDPSLVEADKGTLVSLSKLTLEDIIFRSIMTVSYWITTGTLNLFMHNLFAIVTVLLHFSEPTDCPPLYNSFFDAYTVRQFWGVSWHQMFRKFLTGHADLIVGTLLPFLPRRSLLSRYTRLTIAFLISGMIHFRGDQHIGVPDIENRSIIFFLLQAGAIMLEDAFTPFMTRILPQPLRRVLGWIWVLSVLIWATPGWAYSTVRLGVDPAVLLPIRILGPWLS